MKVDKTSWVSSFQWLRNGGLDDVKLIVEDKCLGMIEAVAKCSSRPHTSGVRSASTAIFLCNTLLQDKAGIQYA